MKRDILDKETIPLCPSARPETKNSAVFGVVAGTVDEPRVNYFKQPQPVTNELTSLASPVTPTEVFRISGECAGNGCKHFDGQNCRLATRVANELSVVAEVLPPCPIRRDCRWWQQEGKSACMRCPQIITDRYDSSPLAGQVAKPIK